MCARLAAPVQHPDGHTIGLDIGRDKTARRSAGREPIVFASACGLLPEMTGSWRSTSTGRNT
jgi:hypothetical protein